MYFTQYFQMFQKSMGFLKIYRANMEPNGKKLRKNSIYRAAIQLWSLLVILVLRLTQFYATCSTKTPPTVGPRKLRNAYADVHRPETINAGC